MRTAKNECAVIVADLFSKKIFVRDCPFVIQLPFTQGPGSKEGLFPRVPYIVFLTNIGVNWLEQLPIDSKGKIFHVEFISPFLCLSRSLLLVGYFSLCIMVSALLLSPLLTLMLASMTTAFSAPTTAAKADIAVVGCGVLGTSLCKQLLTHPDFASRSITAITKSTARHDDIRKQVLQSDGNSDRFTLKTLDDVLETSSSSFQDVVFCAPPSGFDNYPSAVKEAAEKLWAVDKNGSFVFTSSGGVFEGKDGEIVNESSPTLDPETNPRSGRMIYAEQEAIALGGCALRLAGLYTFERGAHSYWLKRCQESGVQGREDGIVNL